MIKKHNRALTAMTLIISISIMTGCASGKLAYKEQGTSNAVAEVVAGSNEAKASPANPVTEVEYAEEDYYEPWEKDKVSTIILNGQSIEASGTGMTVENNKVTITEAGTYVVSGNLADGSIVINEQHKGIVRLILNGMQIHSSTSAPIYIEEAGKVILSLEEGTQNSLSDGTEYIFAGETTDEPNATLFSKADLTINGTGTLTVKANYNNAIVSKDDLNVMEGILVVNSVDDGIIGKDRVAIKDGQITINAQGDGIKSTNSTDASKGFIAIEGGKFNITAGADGIQAETNIAITGGEFVLETGGGSANAPQKVNQNPIGRGRQDRPMQQNQASTLETHQATTLTEKVVSEEEIASSAKGLKAVNDMTILGGKFTIDSADDSLHSNNTLTIEGGEMTLASGDDGVHSDTLLTVKGGDINITKSYEGLESADIILSGGNIHVVASDDGINVAGGNDGTSNGDVFNSTGNNTLTINEGYIVVNASGDGLDANGSIVMTGGTVLVNGPTNNGNGAFDYDGSFDVSGGLLIAAGSAGMMQGISTTSSQAAVLMNFSNTQKANTPISLLDSQGIQIATFAPIKDYQCVLVSSPEIKQGNTYTFSYGGAAEGTVVDGLYKEASYTGGSQVAASTLESIMTYLNESGITTGNPNGQLEGGRGSKGQRPAKENY
ncbi:dockerin type 1 [Sporanaerobium hydrogeniformans]|uniref:Dockerin type 1 n=1 Tax=Sporanaerobium hydrogeniformans TaxID=3072179 RepID=A0AC61D9U0_9FIRM|nr:carbohydrate-binding domain-containing protein [Sporanaerobium hydrogeniformans]PHV69352.1 dockerin type 1 [Sporanaerobium hydrogeniformans]